jgi:hypothetical protein
MIVVRMGMPSCGRRIGSQKLLTAMFAAEVERLTVTLGTTGCRLINRHTANRINGHAIDSMLPAARCLGTRCRIVYQGINAIHQLAALAIALRREILSPNSLNADNELDSGRTGVALSFVRRANTCFGDSGETSE